MVRGKRSHEATCAAAHGAAAQRPARLRPRPAAPLANRRSTSAPALRARVPAHGMARRSGRDRARPCPLLPALALLLGTLGLLAAPPAMAQITVWSATLTVDVDSIFSGCDDHPPAMDACSTSLTDNDFVFGGTTYTVKGLYKASGQDVLFSLDKTVPSAVLTLHLGTTQRSTGTAARENSHGVPGGRWVWYRHGGPSWTDGQQVSVKLTLPMKPGSLRVARGDAKLDLSWTVPSAPSGTVTGYDVHYTSAPKTGNGTVADGATASGSNAATAWVAATRSATDTTTSHTLSSLTNETAYRVRVRARSSSGTGVWAFGRGTPTDKSMDATLSALTAASATSAHGTYGTLGLTPSTFSASATRYTARVANARTHVKLTPTVAATGKATVQVGKRGRTLAAVTSGTASEAVALDVGANVITVRVTAEDGVIVKTYTVTVTRGLPPPTTLALSLSYTRGDNTATERGGTVGVTATLDQPAGSGGVTVTLAADASSTATAGEDYSPLPPAFTIAEGRRSARGLVAVYDDQVDEDDETLVFTATTASGLAVTGVTLTIVDDDTASVRVSESALTVRAGETGSYRVWLATKPTGEVTVTPSSAAPGKATVSGALRFTPGNWHRAQAVTVTGVEAGSATVSHAVRSADAKYEGLSAGTVAVTVGGAPPPPPAVSLSVSPNPVTEGASATVTARLSRALAGSVRVRLTVTRDTSEESDHGTLSEIAVAAGATSGTGRITTAQDPDTEDERFTVALDAANLPSSLRAGSPSSVQIRITDDDRDDGGGGGGGGGAGGGGGGGITPPTVTLSAAPNPVTEGSAVTVTATLSRALAGDVTIPLAVSRDTSEPGDHATLSSIAVAAGATSGTGTIATRRDADGEDETFTVALGTLPSQVTAGSPASVTVTIDDDAVAGAPPAPEVGFFPSASRTLGAMARVVNLSDEAGTVTVRAFDDAGTAYPTQTLALGAGFGVGFGPADLEEGNPDKGLRGTGAGTGDWRLAFESALDLRVLALARPPGGGLAAVHDTAPGSAAGGYEVVFFNPASNRGLASRLRLANRSGSPATVTIAGTDADGQPGESAVTLRIPARAACTLGAPVLESGTWGDTGPGPGCGTLTGALGDGAGKWRLMVTSDQPLAVMSLLASAAGHLTNLSSAPAGAEAGVHRLALLPPADDAQRQGFVRLVNRDTRAGTVTLRAFDDAGQEYPAQTLTLGAGFGVGFSAADLEEGHETLGLTGTGEGAGNWRLVLEPAPADLDLQALSLVRNPGSSGLAALHDTAPGSAAGGYEVAFFNPASNRGLRSRLRLVNRADSPAAVTIAGTDAAGQPGESAVTLRIPAGAACTLSAPVLESGKWGDSGPAAGCEALAGALGDGAGKWRLSVTADRPLAVMGLLRHAASGALSNLSTARK